MGARPACRHQALRRSRLNGGTTLHKELLVLGLLHFGPKTGYDLHRIVVAHGDLYADLKQGNLYYLLDRLAAAGALVVKAEPGARGPRRERLVYTLTEQGRERFHALLRAVVRTYELPYTGIEVGMVFLTHLAPADAVHLLAERREAVLARRAMAVGAAHTAAHLHEELAQDHLLCLMDAELAWIERAADRLRQPSLGPGAPHCPGMPPAEE